MNGLSVFTFIRLGPSLFIGFIRWGQGSRDHYPLSLDESVSEALAGSTSQGWNVLQVVVDTEMTYTYNFLSDPYISSILRTLNQQQTSDE